ncbi:pentatricopeptide repeat-containing protein At1g74600, chloroplastic-like isoform X1 [Prosopis cineraria]|uniref:pentatricopeptide repeat-containing protein At1g74600, chloroplastic-like isoform X1 n=2 Tax=Prosopis cineraria TaxID=364024 RepID=UPI00241073AA|nr:pentatricopeptide repeat-containing protein At1g74600, chloroplastic-like isoform X1 [Prosopis cineraria]XP_054784141.1 pentatricopeptide repeat-containing protein At1g74600, chloroplastic-like isoform X1 [Prosopis cineraria]XP_054784142.1 pentatricopeptide repeat-containing protein At1g74600, chloroplastic-like isoform X1 [Prosopis cineraria]XP_054784143.1 pentatricopeptide repeat-containing protein At1g74600, chloroplastic-like isoform X1 [Prosopis cineraria]XP_054784144.1 pentatricopeptid
MISLIDQCFPARISHLACRFTSSLALIGMSYPISHEHEENSKPLDPFKLFSDHRMSRQPSIRSTKILHAYLVKIDALQSNVFFTNSLLNLYCKSSAMVVACKLFDSITLPNIQSWNIMISGYNGNSMYEKSWEMFCRMHSFGEELNEFTYGSVLSACAALQASALGKQVYSLAMKKGFVFNGYVRTGMIDMFSKNCSFEEAQRVFFDVSCDNMVCWNAMISGAVRNGEYWAALNLFCQMCHQSLKPNGYTFPSVLTACCSLKELQIGEIIHGRVIKCVAADIFVDTAIVDLYAKCGRMDEAGRKFLQMPVHNVVSWTAIISGFVQENDSISALKFFKHMRESGEEINTYTVTSVLAACSKPGMIEEASQIHSLILKLPLISEATVQATLINMYAKIGEVGLSDLAFSEIKYVKDVRIWAAMMSSYAYNQNSRKAVEFFVFMLQEGVRPDEYYMSIVLSIINCLYIVRQMHSYTLKSGLVTNATVGCSLFTMYSKCGCLEESHRVFEEAPDKDNVSWASMIAGFVEHGYAGHAFHLFKEMLSQEILPDYLTLTAVLTACSALSFLQTGKEIHGYAFRLGMGTDTVIGGALVSTYSKCGRLELAKRVFNMLPQKDKVACSSLVSGYAQNGLIEEAFLLFRDMILTDLPIDTFIISSVLRAIALSNRSSAGTQLHAYIEKLGLQSDVYVGSSLVTMYSKCGSLEDCCKAFDHIEKPDLIGWTAIIVSYAQHGQGSKALATYELMRREGIQPDAVTFVAVLLACSHSGLVEEAFFYLNSMVRDCGIKPCHRHYACIVDLLGRSGRLKEAENFINTMPVKPDALIWGTLLAACKVHGDYELGKLAAQKVMELEQCDAGAYVSFSNICADLGQWDEVLRIRGLMKGSGTAKEPGWSFVLGNTPSRIIRDVT